MDRKLDNLVSLGCLVLVAITFINCSVAMNGNKLDDDHKVDLDAIENVTERDAARNNKTGAYFPFFVKLKRA